MFKAEKNIDLVPQKGIGYYQGDKSNSSNNLFEL